MYKLLLINIFFYTFLFCQDSSKVFKLEEVLISSSKIISSQKELPYSAIIVGANDIENSNGNELTKVLNYQSGIFIKSYGVAGQLQTISTRGTSSDESIILIDGIKMPQIQNGTADLSLFNFQSLESIEILKGGNSSLYGSNAIGGVVNLISKKNKVGFKNIFTSANSFGGSKLSFSTNDSLFNNNYTVNFAKETGTGKFPFYFNDGNSKQILLREKSNFDISQFSILLESRNDGSIFKQNLQLSLADKGIPGIFASVGNDDNSKQNDKTIFYSLSNNFEFSQNVNFTFNSALQYSEQKYYSEKLKLNSFHINRSYILQPEVYFQLSEASKLIAGAEIIHSNVTSTDLINNSKNIFSFYLTMKQKSKINFVLNQLHIYPSIRSDNSKNYSQLSPSIGINLADEGESIILKSSIGKSFREPTFNELYWKPGGNAKLKPEVSQNSEIGILISPQNMQSEFDLNIYSISIANRIIWLPNQLGIWSAQNIQKVNSNGIEFAAATHFFENKLNFSYKYTFSNVLKKNKNYEGDESYNKQLPFQPKEISILTLNLTLDKFSLNIFHGSTGYRFITADNNPKNMLPSFNKTDANVSYKYFTENYILTTKIEVDNIFNTDYQIIYQYPMPIRNYLLTIQLNTK